MKPTTLQQEKLDAFAVALKKYITKLAQTGYFNNRTFEFTSTKTLPPDPFPKMSTSPEE